MTREDTRHEPEGLSPGAQRAHPTTPAGRRGARAPINRLRAGVPQNLAARRRTSLSKIRLGVNSATWGRTSTEPPEQAARAAGRTGKLSRSVGDQAQRPLPPAFQRRAANPSKRVRQEKKAMRAQLREKTIEPASFAEDTELPMTPGRVHEKSATNAEPRRGDGAQSIAVR